MVSEVFTVRVRQLSGAEEEFDLQADMTVREFKRELHGWLPCEDESKRNMAIPGAEVLAFLSMQPAVMSSRFETSACELEYLRVAEILAVGRIEAGAFHGCSSLASETIPGPTP